MLTAGCGLGLTDERSGGSENLPTAGAGPYIRLAPDPDTPSNEPLVVEERFFGFGDPSPMLRDDGGFRLWFGRTDPLVSGESEIWYAELPDLHELPDRGPEPALVATEAWEAGRVAGPHVVDLGDGELAMFYEGGDPTSPAVGRADSSDDGATWTKYPDNPVLIDATAPTVVFLEQAWLMYTTRPSRPGIFLVDSADGINWQFSSEPVIEARPELDEAFDAFDVGDPYVIVRRTEAGVVLYSLWFNGVDGPSEDSDIAVGYAGSFGGLVWERFMGPEAVLLSRGPDVRGPSVLLEPTQSIMFFHEISGAPPLGKIVAARHP